MAKFKLKFVRSHPRYAHFAGDEIWLEDARAKELIDGQYVEVLIEKKAPPAKKKK